MPHFQRLPAQRLVDTPHATHKSMTQQINAYSSSELIALLIAPKAPQRKHLQIAQALLASEGSLLQVLLPHDTYAPYTSNLLEPIQVYKLLAISELNRRLLLEELPIKDVLNDAETVKKFCIAQLGGKMVECCYGIFLNAQHQLLDATLLAEGTIDQAAIYPREIVKHALKVHATSIIIAHNHPSGSIHPSESDLQFTRHLQKALRLLDIELLDHIIVGENKGYSFAQNHLLSC